MASVGNDFQNQRMIFVDNEEKGNWKKGGRHTRITSENLIPVSIYFAVRKVIPATWLNDRDQFLNPNDNWKTDKEFQNDCLTYTLFNNNIQIKFGVNHWIPFTESEVNAKEKFESNFMTDFIKGKIKTENFGNLFGNETTDNKVLQFSQEAMDVFNAGRELWKYYHSQKDINVNASLYDIREYFQGRNDKGRMNAKSTDEKYTELISNLRQTLSILASKIAPKVYEYEFLKQ